MSENLDLVRSIYAGWERGDYRTTDWAAPDIEFVIASGPDPGAWAGTSAMSDGWRAWLSAWDDYVAEAEEFRELDGERVLVFGRMGGRGKASGLRVDTEFANVFDLRGGAVTRLRLYADRESALADLGLQE
jgi:ketosteroid isomerase-like protein